MGRHVFGDAGRICGGSSSFEDIRGGGYFYVDKSPFIEHFLHETWKVSLIARPRRFGKSLNMDMLRCFLTDAKDNRRLFEGLAIERSDVWGLANSAPVFHFDFKDLEPTDYRESILARIAEYLNKYTPGIGSDDLLSEIDKYRHGLFQGRGLRLLAQAAHAATGKRSYILIDEYDKLLIDKAGSSRYPEIREFMSYLFSAAFKGNPYLEKGLLTGVMRVSHESMFSGLNNIGTFDVFGDGAYAGDCGFTYGEMEEISAACGFDAGEARRWYNGFAIGGVELCNTWSVLNYISKREFAAYWGKSGTMELVSGLVTGRRAAVLNDLLSGGSRAVRISPTVSFAQLNRRNDAAFYSLLAQAGYLSVRSLDPNGNAEVSIPNREMEGIWADFIAQDVIPGEQPLIEAVFAPGLPASRFAGLLGELVSDMLSFHDLVGDREGAYHVFVLGMLTALAWDTGRKPKSNRESGDGRYDVWMERNGINYIFEFKKSGSRGTLGRDSELAVSQIERKRYGAELDRTKPLWKVGVAFCGKECRASCKIEAPPAARN
jgi:hypothetical protein